MSAFLAATTRVGIYSFSAVQIPLLGRKLALVPQGVITRSHFACSYSPQNSTATSESFQSLSRIPKLHIERLITSASAPGHNPSLPRSSMQFQNEAPGKPVTLPECDEKIVGSAPGSVRIAVGQMTSTADQADNFATCARLANDAAAAGCRMLFLPECFSFIGESQAQSLSAAQPLDGPLMSQYRQLASSLGLWLSLGGFQEVGPDPHHIYNTHVILDSSGHTVARYRKIHLFDVDVPNGPVLMESRSTAPGTEAVVVDTPAGRLGLSTCYDLRFPELFAHLTWDLGSQILAVPSAFTVVTGVAHWEVLLRARAIECQSYVVAAAQGGRHNAKRESYGHALVVDPWGTVVARLPDPRATGIAVAELDSELLARTRERMPCQLHRAKGLAAYHGK